MSHVTMYAQRKNLQRFNHHLIKELKKIKREEENITTQRRRWINNEIDRLQKEIEQLEVENE